MNKKERQFISTVWDFYTANGRHDLAWRQTIDAYRIAVSEVMLQQTQVIRVEVKYAQFIQAFPNTKRLANASLAEVLQRWQGLGYNCRAKLLWQAAKLVHNEYHGRWPRSYAGLQALPGIGPYTAGAICAFAYNEARPIIETNIRTVYLHHFWPQQTAVRDEDILRLVAKTLPADQARTWYWALMDYGSYLKQSGYSRNQQSKHYTKQSRFAGSVRQIRGAIVRTLGAVDGLDEAALQAALTDVTSEMRTQALKALLAEEMVVYDSDTGQYRLPR